MEKKTQEELQAIKEALLILKQQGNTEVNLFDMLVNKKEKQVM